MSDNNATPQTPFGNDPQSGDAQSQSPFSSPQQSGAPSGYDQSAYQQTPSTPQSQPAQPSVVSNPFQSQPDASGYAQQPYASAGQAYAQTPQPADAGQSYSQQPQPNPYEQDHPNAQTGPEFGAPNPYAQTGYGPAGAPPSGQPYPPQGYAYPYPMPANQRWNTLCIVGFVLAFVFAPVGVVLSIIAMIQINKSGEKSKGMALAGIIVGAINTVLMVVAIVAIVAFMGAAMDAVEHGYSFDYGDGGSYSTDCAVKINGECVRYNDLRKYGIDPDDLDDLRDLSRLGLDFGSGSGQTTSWDGDAVAVR